MENFLKNLKNFHTNFHYKKKKIEKIQQDFMKQKFR